MCRDIMRNLEIRISAKGDEFKWKVSATPNEKPMTSKELERAADILDDVRMAILKRGYEKNVNRRKNIKESNPTTGVEKILSKVKV